MAEITIIDYGYVLIAVGSVMGWSYIVNMLCLCFLLWSNFYSLNTRLTRASINGHRFVEVTYAKEALFYQSSRQHIIRHVACTTRPKGHFAMRITRYPNSDLTFRLQRLLSCGDVSTNPGQVDALNSRSNPWENSWNACQLCERTVARNHCTLKYTQCNLRAHMKCGEMSPREYKLPQQRSNLRRVLH